MKFLEQLNQALEKLENKCLSCGKLIDIKSGEPLTCDCRWNNNTPKTKPFLQLGQRYSELARMRQSHQPPGINAGPPA